MSVTDAALALGVHRSVIIKALRSGELKHMQVGKKEMLDLEDAEAYLATIGDRMTLSEYAKHIGVTRHAVALMIKEGLIPAEKIGREWRIRAPAADAGLERKMKGG